MQSVSALLANKAKQNTKQQTGLEKYNKPSFKQKTTDLVIADNSDLINFEFLGWYYKVAFLIGADRFAACASQARVDGNDPARLFSHILSREVCGG